MTHQGRLILWRVKYRLMIEWACAQIRSEKTVPARLADPFEVNAYRDALRLIHALEKYQSGKGSRIKLAIWLILLVTTTAKAQSRLLVGPNGGYVLDNAFLGGALSVEVPIQRFEVDLNGRGSFEHHSGLGNGWSEENQVKTLAWITSRFGLDGTADRDAYGVPHITKSLSFVQAGAVWRGHLDERPVRLTVNYVREYKNRIDRSGTETPKLQGGQIVFDARVGCTKSYCVRLKEEFTVGHVLTQGNPVCDGTFGLTGGPNNGPCPRQGAWSGGSEVTVFLELPIRRRQ